MQNELPTKQSYPNNKIQETEQAAKDAEYAFMQVMDSIEYLDEIGKLERQVVFWRTLGVMLVLFFCFMLVFLFIIITIT